MAMTIERMAVKAQLALCRSVQRGRRSVLLCDLCGAENASDLHEVLVERDDVQGNSERIQKLVTESHQNLQFLCNPCNIGPAKQGDKREELIAKQILRAGEVVNKRVPMWNDLPPVTQRRTAIIMGWGLLEDWLYSLTAEVDGMLDVGPYVRRLALVAERLLLETDETV